MSVSTTFHGNLYLTGLMGAGKSTVGMHLAELLGKQFFDCDSEIEKRTGVSVAWIFDIEGESGFRQRESDMISELVQLKNIVLATGGGSILREQNRHLLKQNGTVIYLKAAADLISQRLMYDKKRPLLQIDDKFKRIENLLLERSPLYESCADLVYLTSDDLPRNIALDIIKKLPKSLAN